MGFFLQFLNVIPMEEQIEKNHIIQGRKRAHWNNHDV